MLNCFLFNRLSWVFNCYIPITPLGNHGQPSETHLPLLLLKSLDQSYVGAGQSEDTMLTSTNIHISTPIQKKVIPKKYRKLFQLPHSTLCPYRDTRISADIQTFPYIYRPITDRDNVHRYISNISKLLIRKYIASLWRVRPSRPH